MPKQILITGGTSGIGYELVKHFVTNGDSVVFTARNPEKATDIQEKFQKLGFQVAFQIVDFASFDSILSAAANLSRNYPPFDVLINNAGTWEMQFSETRDSIETNFAVNHLAPMLLTLELLPVLKTAPQCRIINTSSGAHRRNILVLEDLEFRNRPYDGVATYSQSKLCNLLFSLHLQTELAGSSVTVNTVHPGYVKTELFRNWENRNWEQVPDAKTGAQSAIFAATSPTLEGKSGLYLYHSAEDPNLSPLAKDYSLALQLWNLSIAYFEKHAIQKQIRSL